MDSLDLIEKYVEAGCGVGLSIQIPGQKVSSKLRVLSLPDFPSVTLAVIHRTEPNANGEICRAFLEAVQAEAARLKLSA